MSNGHDKLYRVIDLSGKPADVVQAELNQAEADGFGEFRGVNGNLVFLYQGKRKTASAKRK